MDQLKEPEGFKSQSTEGTYLPSFKGLSIEHDVNNMLTPVLGILDTIFFKYHGEAYAVLDCEYKKIKEDANHTFDAVLLIKDKIIPKLRTILSQSKEKSDYLSKLENINKTIQALIAYHESPARVSLKTILEDVKDCFLIYLGESKINLSMEICQNIHIFIPPEHFKSTLYNILKNAAEAISVLPKEDGMIRVHVTILPEQAQVSITIRDNGIGMTPSQLDAYGERQFSTKSDQRGIGALSTKFFMTAQNADFKIISKPGCGTQVTIKLPMIS
ncbi:MAG: ATP-binding protein [Candidatus Gracilibacteria bacterium]